MTSPTCFHVSIVPQRYGNPILKKSSNNGKMVSIVPQRYGNYILPCQDIRCMIVSIVPQRYGNSTSFSPSSSLSLFQQFLRGMETNWGRVLQMKTISFNSSLEVWKRSRDKSISAKEIAFQQFLRGMETGKFGQQNEYREMFQYFLRGMETFL